MLLEYIRINDHAINLIERYQLLYKSIYSLRLIELKTLKIYIKINLANSFIKLSKSFIGVLILFIKKLKRSLQLYINYKDFNNLIIKN